MTLNITRSKLPHIFSTSPNSSLFHYHDTISHSNTFAIRHFLVKQIRKNLLCV